MKCHKNISNAECDQCVVRMCEIRAASLFREIFAFQSFSAPRCGQLEWYDQEPFKRVPVISE